MKSVAEGSFVPGNGWQEIILSTPVQGRYVCLVGLNALDGKDLASIAELYVLDTNGERLSREAWTVSYADSEDVSYVNCSAEKVFDLQESTYWKTKRKVKYPHYIVIDLGDEHIVSGIQYLPRMESQVPGGIKDYKIFIR